MERDPHRDREGRPTRTEHQQPVAGANGVFLGEPDPRCIETLEVRVQRMVDEHDLRFREVRTARRNSIGSTDRRTRRPKEYCHRYAPLKCGSRILGLPIHVTLTWIIFRTGLLRRPFTSPKGKLANRHLLEDSLSGLELPRRPWRPPSAPRERSARSASAQPTGMLCPLSGSRLRYAGDRHGRAPAAGSNQGPALAETDTR